MIRPLDYKGISGVYKITQPDGRYYIGSSKDVYSRLRQHKSYLNTKCKWSPFTFQFDELIVEILEVTSDVKTAENKYLNQLWSDDILNREENSTGRNIRKDKNPNWKNSVVLDVYCKCGAKIYSEYRKHKNAISCKPCVAKSRVRNEKGHFIKLNK